MGFMRETKVRKAEGKTKVRITVSKIPVSSCMLSTVKLIGSQKFNQYLFCVTCYSAKSHLKITFMSTEPWTSEVNLVEAVANGFTQTGRWNSRRLSS